MTAVFSMIDSLVSTRANLPHERGERLQLDPVDLKHLRRYTLGDAALEREVLDLFFGQLPATLSALSNARTPQDWKVAAHTLKGSGRAVGAWRIARLAEQAERSELFHTPDLLAETLDRLEEAVLEARAFVAAAYG